MSSASPTIAEQSLTAAARSELLAIETELRRRQYLEDPGLWAQEALGSYLWSAQQRILRSIRDHRKTAVKSCHGPGKSFTAASAVAHWIANHRAGEATAVTSAPTDRQVKAILWKEIGRAHARGRLAGRVNLKEWYIPTPPSGRLEMVAFGQKPADLDPTAFQGIHNRSLLVVLDEACGMPKALFIAADSLMTNDNCRILAIGNPDDPTSHFAEICRVGTDWNVISISAFDTPNFTGEAIPAKLAEVLVGRTWVEDKRKLWAPEWRWTEDGRFCLPPPGKKVEDSDPEWQSKVLGLFPAKGGPLSLIPSHWIEAAQERSLTPSEPYFFGVDVGAGGDSSCIAFRQGPVIRIIHEDRNPDTMQTTGAVIAYRRKAAAALDGLRPAVQVDKIGIGAGIVDRSIELGEDFIGINVGLPARDPERFANLKAEAWWGVRERFEAGDIDLDPADLRTASELASLRYRRNSRGQILIESKEEAKRRGIPSPNRAEAVMLSCAVPNEAPQKRTLKGGLLW